MRMLGPVALAAFVGLAAVHGFAQVDHGGGSELCDQGNVTVTTGERTYHVPGFEHYDETIIIAAEGAH